MTKRLKVLAADDETEICNLIRHWLEAAGHEVQCAGSARAATAVLKAGPIDLVVTDILMPGGDGLDLIAETKKLQPGARLLAMSGGGRYVDTNDCLRMARGFGAHAALNKPFNREQFEAGGGAGARAVAGSGGVVTRGRSPAGAKNRGETGKGGVSPASRPRPAGARGEGGPRRRASSRATRGSRP